jgi:hypothetical protein
MPGAISVNTPQDRRFGQPAIVGYVALAPGRAESSTAAQVISQ